MAHKRGMGMSQERRLKKGAQRRVMPHNAALFSRETGVKNRWIRVKRGDFGAEERHELARSRTNGRGLRAGARLALAGWRLAIHDLTLHHTDIRMQVVFDRVQ